MLQDQVISKEFIDQLQLLAYELHKQLTCLEMVQVGTSVYIGSQLDSSICIIIQPDLFIILYFQIDMTQKSLMYMQENHRKYPKLCVYWLGPFIPWVFTGDVKTMKMFLCQPGGRILIARNFTVLPYMQLCKYLCMSL